MSVQPDEDELQLRARLRDLIDHGVSPAPAERDHLEVPGSAGEETSVDALRSWADDEAQAPAAPAPRPSSPRLPDWWSKDRPPLAVVPEPEDQEDQEDREDQEEPDVPAADEDREPGEGEETTSSRPALRKRARSWVDNVLDRSSSDIAEDTEDDEDQEDGEGEPGEEDTGDTGGDAPAQGAPAKGAPAKGGPTPGGPVSKTTGALRWRSRPRKAPRPRHRPRFAAAGIPHTMKPEKERRSLVEIIRNTPDHVRWMTYSGSALATGFWLGWPQWVMDGTAYLATERTPTDAYSLTCYGLAGGVFLLDSASRGQRLPLAWSVRVFSSSLVAGVLMYGDPTPISQLF